MGRAVPCPQDLYVAEALSTLESWRSRYNQVVKDKGDLELEIIVLNEYVCVGRGQRARRPTEGGGRSLATRGSHVTHMAAIWSPPVKGCTGLRCGLSSWTPDPGSSPGTHGPVPRQSWGQASADLHTTGNGHWPTGHLTPALGGGMAGNPYVSTVLPAGQYVGVMGCVLSSDYSVILSVSYVHMFIPLKILSNSCIPGYVLAFRVTAVKTTNAALLSWTLQTCVQMEAMGLPRPGHRGLTWSPGQQSLP